MKRSNTTTSMGSTFKRARLVTKSSTVKSPASKTQELKRAQTAVIPTATGVGTAGSLFVYPRIAAGDGDDEREGRAIKIRGIELIGTAQASTETNNILVRMITFLWKQALVTPTAADILTSTGLTPFYGTYNISQANNYEIYKDDILNLSDVGQRTKPFHIQKNLGVIQNYFGPALTEQSDRDIWVFVVTSTAAGAVVTAGGATTFVDM